MRFLSLITLFFSVSVSWAQTPKKLSKLIPYDVKYMKAEDSYSWRPSDTASYHKSWTLKGDTIGAANKNEFLMFRDSVAIVDEQELFKLFRTDYVTNSEYNEFIDWVLDSIRREKIYVNNNPTGNNAIPDELIADMLDHPEVYYDEVNQKMQEFDPSAPFINRSLFSFDWDFNWEKKIGYARYAPLISDMYLRPNERFNKSSALDERKFNYKIKGVHPGTNGNFAGFEFYLINISKDATVWAKNSEYPYDAHYNLAHYYSHWGSFLDFPVIGLLGTQVRAYLNYLEYELQASIDQKKLPYKVRISLPTEKELKQNDCNCEEGSLGIYSEEMDMTEQWQITNTEYQEFCFWVEDSLCREAVYRNIYGKLENEDISEMLIHPDVYFDEVNISWTEFDPSQAFINRRLHMFNWDFDWKKKFPKEQTDSLLTDLYNEDGIIKEKLIYKYYWQDLQRRSQWGTFTWREELENYHFYESDDYWANRNLSMSNGVRRNEDISHFIIQENVNVYPTVKCQDCNQICYHDLGDPFADPTNPGHGCGKCPDEKKTTFESYDFMSNPEGLVVGLSYAQAMAYYNWKYHRNTWYSNSASVLFDDLVPSREQFDRVQKGESIVVPKKDIPYPSPLFRYVIHVYKR